MEDFTICLNCMTANSQDSTECYECHEPISYVPITMTPRQLGQAFRRLGPNPDPIAFNKLRAQEKWRRIPFNPNEKWPVGYPICLNCQKPTEKRLTAYCSCGARIKP